MSSANPDEKRHAFRHIARVIREEKLYQDRHWNNEELVVKMPTPETNMRLTRDVKSERYGIFPEYPESDLGRALIETNKWVDGQCSYTEQQIGETLSRIRDMYCNIARDEQRELDLGGNRR